MSGLTKQQAIDLHKKKWTWIAEKTEHEKRIVRSDEYFKSEGIDDIPYIYSYCCEYGKSRSTIGRRLCQCCPVEWPKTKPVISTCQCMESYYGQWAKTRKWQEAADLARKIAELGDD